VQYQAIQAMISLCGPKLDYNTLHQLSDLQYFRGPHPELDAFLSNFIFLHGKVKIKLSAEQNPFNQGFSISLWWLWCCGAGGLAASQGEASLSTVFRR
jgi:hypothetical protein